MSWKTLSNNGTKLVNGKFRSVLRKGATSYLCKVNVIEALGALRLLRSSRVALTQPDACGAGESRATTNLGRAANRAMRDLNRRLAGRASGFAWPAAKSPLQPCGLSPPAKTRIRPYGAARISGNFFAIIVAI